MLALMVAAASALGCTSDSKDSATTTQVDSPTDASSTRSDGEGGGREDGPTQPDPAAPESTTQEISPEITSLLDHCDYDLARVADATLELGEALELERSTYVTGDGTEYCESPRFELAMGAFTNQARASLVKIDGAADLADPELAPLFGTIFAEGTCSDRSQPLGPHELVRFCEQQLREGSFPTGGRAVAFRVGTPEGEANLVLIVRMSAEGWPADGFPPEFPDEATLIAAVEEVLASTGDPAVRAGPDLAREVEAGQEAFAIAEQLAAAGFADGCIEPAATSYQEVPIVVRASLCSREDGGRQYQVLGISTAEELSTLVSEVFCTGSYEDVISTGTSLVVVENGENTDYLWAELDQAGLEPVTVC